MLIKIPHRASRRQLLRASKALLALPFLPSMHSAWANTGAEPKRLVFWVTTNGHDSPNFFPPAGPLGQLPDRLASLQNYKDKLTVIQGIWNPQAARAKSASYDPPYESHGHPHSSVLTCSAKVTNEGSANSISVDQVAHKTLSAGRLSLQLGINAADITYSGGKHGDAISFDAEGRAIERVLNTREVFNRLFPSPASQASQTSPQNAKKPRKGLLHYVASEARTLRTKLSRSDKAKLDEYLTSVEETEARVNDVVEITPTAACVPGSAPSLGRPWYQAIDDMVSLQALAIQCDASRVMTFQLLNAGANGTNFGPVLPGIPSDYHIQVVHASNLPWFRKVKDWETSKFAELVKKLDVSDSQGGKLLDHCGLLMTSALGGHGNEHAHTDLPVMIVGTLGGQLSAGRALKVEKQNIARVHLRLLQASGVSASAFGQEANGTAVTAPLAI